MALHGLLVVTQDSYIKHNQQNSGIPVLSQPESGVRCKLMNNVGIQPCVANLN